MLDRWDDRYDTGLMQNDTNCPCDGTRLCQTCHADPPETNLSPYHCDLLEQEAELWETLQELQLDLSLGDPEVYLAREQWNAIHTLCINAGLEEYLND